MERVENHANEQWKVQMLEVLREVARTHREFTADLPMEVYERDPERPRTHNNRAMGPLVVQAMKEGVIRKKEGCFQNSIRRSCHNRPIQIYVSLIYEGDN